MITFTQLHYFLEVCKMKNFTKAANSLFVTQQTLSNHISSIEKTLGTKLFYRTTPLQLTYAGKRFEHYALLLTRTEQEMLTEFSDITEGKRGQIQFGISYNRGAILLPKILSKFKQEFPHVDVKIVEGSSLELQKLLVSNSIDIILEQLPFSYENISYYELEQDYLYLLVTDEYLEKCFPSNYIQVKSSLLASGKIHLLKPCNFLLNKPGNSIRSAMDSIFLEEKMDANIQTESDNLDTLYNLCINHYGCTIYPGGFLNSMNPAPADHLNIIRLNYENAGYSLGIGYLKEHYMSVACKGFIKLILSCYESINP